MGKHVSCIIATKNEERVIKTLLSSIKTQSCKNFEIVLVDNYSTDKTRQIAEAFPARVFDKGPERSVQRNYGVDKSKGEYVLILDADMILSGDVLKECISKVIEDPKLEALVIPEVSFGRGMWVKFKIFERELYLGDATIEAPRFFRKSVFKKFGGYDERITGPEDWDLPLRMKKAGIKIGRIKSVIRHNEGRFSPFKSAKKKFYYASHAGVFLKRYPEQVFSKGNLIFRPIFFKRWKKLVSHPILTAGMFIVKILEGLAALAGVLYSVIIPIKSNAKHN